MQPEEHGKCIEQLMDKYIKVFEQEEKKISIQT